jgi:hypothetical protein
MPSSLVQLRAIKKKAPGSDAKFFTTNRKGENHELREELRSPDRNRKRDAVKKVRFPSRRWSLILSLLSSGHRQHDGRQRCLHFVHGCCELYPNW